MATCETLSRSDGIKQGLFSVGSHGRLAVHALFLDQIALALKQETVVFFQRFGKEDATVLRAGYFEAVLIGQVGDDSLRERELSAFALDNGVLKSLRAREHEQPGLLFFLVGAKRLGNRN